MGDTRVAPLTDEEMNYTAEQWAEAFAEDPSCIRTYILAAYARGVSEAQRITDVEVAAERRNNAASKTAFRKGALAAYEDIARRLRNLTPKAQP